MQSITRSTATLAIIAALTAVIACSDRASTAPEGSLSKNGTSIDTTTKPDTTRQHPDTGGTHPDTGGTHPDTGATHPDTGGTHPDTGGTHPDTGSTHPDTGRGHSPDTTGTYGPDTTQTDAFLKGTVVGVDSSAGGGSTITARPLANVTVTVFKRATQNYASTNPPQIVHGDSIASMKTRSDGTFTFEKLRGGYYILRAVPDANSGWPTVDGYPATAWPQSSLVLTAPIIIYLHKK